MHGISFVKVDINREVKHVSIEGGGRDHNMCSWDTLVHQVQKHIEQNSRRAHGRLVVKKLIETTGQSLNEGPKSKAEENTTMSSLGYTTRNAKEEGDRERGRGGGRQALHHADGDVSMCILSSRDESARYCSGTHDPRPTKTTLTTHDRSHSRRRGAAAKSTGDQSKKKRVTVVTK